ncbi:hypothetical protein FKP32DRAFT_287677 [Trametes sanguinea]|nr:hypothetical protein FKP32DRAFT_287677 [Trametes sanguinea]
MTRRGRRFSPTTHLATVSHNVAQAPKNGTISLAWHRGFVALVGPRVGSAARAAISGLNTRPTRSASRSCATPQPPSTSPSPRKTSCGTTQCGPRCTPSEPVDARDLHRREREHRGWGVLCGDGGVSCGAGTTRARGSSCETVPRYDLAAGGARYRQGIRHRGAPVLPARLRARRRSIPGPPRVGVLPRGQVRPCAARRDGSVHEGPCTVPLHLALSPQHTQYLPLHPQLCRANRRADGPHPGATPCRACAGAWTRRALCAAVSTCCSGSGSPRRTSFRTT